MVAAHKLVKEQQSHIQTVICGAHNFHLVARDLEELDTLNKVPKSYVFLGTWFSF